MANERDDKGRFIPGNRASPGRARRKTEADYMAATISSVPVAKWQKVIEKAVAQAIEGDQAARRFLAEYVLGKPPQILELQGAEARLLADILDELKARGIAPTALFQTMLEELESEGDSDE